MRYYWVYLLLCDDASFYTGISSDVDCRVAQHNEGIDPHCYTYTRRPLKLVFATSYNDPESAIAFEKQLKGWSRKKKWALIRGNFGHLQRLSKRRGGE